MKSRSVLVAIIILAQLGWLAVNYSTYAENLANAPRIRVRAEFNKAGNACVKGEALELSPDSPHLGKSIWWAADTFKGHQDETAIPARENPGDAVQGAMKLCDSSWRMKFSVIWSKQADGLWDYRLEARGSSEDIIGEGQYRTEGQLSFITNNPKVTLHLDLFPQPLIYVFSGDMKQAISEWQKKASAGEELDATLELAMLPAGQTKATLCFINGIPASDAIRLMKEGDFPKPSTEGEKSD